MYQGRRKFGKIYSTRELIGIKIQLQKYRQRKNILSCSVTLEGFLSSSRGGKKFGKIYSTRELIGIKIQLQKYRQRKNILSCSVTLEGFLSSSRGGKKLHRDDKLSSKYIHVTEIHATKQYSILIRYTGGVPIQFKRGQTGRKAGKIYSTLELIFVKKYLQKYRQRTTFYPAGGVPIQFKRRQARRKAGKIYSTRELIFVKIQLQKYRQRTIFHPDTLHWRDSCYVTLEGSRSSSKGG
eukprot:gene12838-biopygen3484